MICKQFTQVMFTLKKNPGHTSDSSNVLTNYYYITEMLITLGYHITRENKDNAGDKWHC